MTAMMLVTAIAVQAQDALTVDGTESYYNLLVNGTDYVLPGTDGSWYCQPGFFTHKEGDVWTFNANSEANFAYCITLDEGLKYVDVTLLNAQGGEGVGDASTATWDANKALWVNGSEGIGFPSFATNKINWTGGHDVAVPMIADGIYQLTLIIGQQLSASAVNFKFFKGKNWGGDVDGSVVWMVENDYLYLGGQEGASGDNGNIYKKDGVQVGDLDTLTLIIDMNDKEYEREGTITVKYGLYTPPAIPAIDGVELTKSGNFYYRDMTFAKGDEFTISNTDQLGMDIATAFADEHALTALGDGKYKVNVVNGDYCVAVIPSLNYIKLFPGTFENPGTWDNGKALWIIGGGIGKPSVAANNSNWGANLLTSIPVAQVEENIYKVTLTMGRELSDINFKFFGQYGWGTEFRHEDLTIVENDYIRMNQPECILLYETDGSLTINHGGDDGNIWSAGTAMANNDKITLTINMADWAPCTYDEEEWLILSHPGTITVEYTPNEAPKPTFDGVEMIGNGNWYYIDAQLEQGKTYTVENLTDVDPAALYTDPCFVTNHGDGTFTFNAVSGSYCFMVNTGGYVRVNPGTYSAPAGIADGGLWIIGEGFGRPSVNTNAIGWNTGALVDWPVAQTQPGIFQMNLTCDTEMWDNWCNYKFFGQPDWGIEFKPGTEYSITSDNEWLAVGEDDGNIKFKDGASFTKGEPIYIVIDFTAGLDAGVMYVSTTPIISGVDKPHADAADEAVYTLQGIRISQPAQPGFYISGGHVFMVK